MNLDQPVENHEDLLGVIDGLLSEAGIDRKTLDGTLTFAGMDPIRATRMKVGSIAATATGANAVASALIWQNRSGEGQDIHVDLRKAYISHSEYQDTAAKALTINGVPHLVGGSVGGFGFEILPTKDNRFVMICSPYQKHAERIMKLLDTGTLPRQLELATMQWNAEELEKRAQDAEICCVMVRTVEEFAQTEQYRVSATMPLITVEKIAESDPEPFGRGARPLSGVRVLGMSHVIAGPVIMRQLAAQGADCLQLNSLNWTEWPGFYWHSDAGMRQAYLDARVDANRKPIYELVKEADIFVQNMRPGLADKCGFSPEQLAEFRPGIIHVNVSFNHPAGPWGHWLGFDFNAGALTGLYSQLGTPDQPAAPHQVGVTCDFITGYLGAIGAQAALLRRATEGGSYRVHVSLVQSVMFEQALGLIDKNVLLDLESLGEDHRPVPPVIQKGTTPFGEFTRLGSQIEMSKTPEYWEDPMMSPIGSSKAEWLPR